LKEKHFPFEEKGTDFSKDFPYAYVQLWDGYARIIT